MELASSLAVKLLVFLALAEAEAREASLLALFSWSSEASGGPPAKCGF